MQSPKAVLTPVVTGLIGVGGSIGGMLGAAMATVVTGLSGVGGSIGGVLRAAMTRGMPRGVPGTAMTTGTGGVPGWDDEDNWPIVTINRTLLRLPMGTLSAGQS